LQWDSILSPSPVLSPAFLILRKSAMTIAKRQIP
jgi:hypothetical protein